MVNYKTNNIVIHSTKDMPNNLRNYRHGIIGIKVKFNTNILDEFTSKFKVKKIYS